jgi:hypothetical protein
MFRKDAVANMTIGEQLLYFCTSVATGTHQKHSAQKRVIKDVMTHVYMDLLRTQVDECKAATALAQKFIDYSENDGTITLCSYEFLNACATLCLDYAETIHHLYNEELDTLPF